VEQTHLEDDGAFKDDQHEEGEERVVPVLVQTPETDTEELEHKEGRHRVLAKDFPEAWHRDVERVLAELRLVESDLATGLDAL
jgi:hypothetical protein